MINTTVENPTQERQRSQHVGNKNLKEGPGQVGQVKQTGQVVQGPNGSDVKDPVTGADRRYSRCGSRYGGKQEILRQIKVNEQKATYCFDRLERRLDGT